MGWVLFFCRHFGYCEFHFAIKVAFNKVCYGNTHRPLGTRRIRIAIKNIGIQHATPKVVEQTLLHQLAIICVASGNKIVSLRVVRSDPCTF